MRSEGTNTFKLLNLGFMAWFLRSGSFLASVGFISMITSDIWVARFISLAKIVLDGRKPLSSESNVGCLVFIHSYTVTFSPCKHMCFSSL